MEYSIKAVIEEGDLRRKYLENFSGVEIQLLPESEKIRIEDHLSEVEKSKVDIISVHTVLKDSKAVDVEDINEKDYFTSFEYAMNLANSIALLQDKEKVVVVVHTELSPLGDTYYELIIKETAKTLDNLLEKYTRVTIALENTTLIKNMNSGIKFTNCYGNTIKVCESLKSISRFPKRIGIVIDTCHAEINERLAKVIKKLIPDARGLTTLEDMFIDSGKYVEIVHLSDTNGLGYGYRGHGAGFTEEDGSLNRLKRYLNLIDKYCPNAKVVLEITEDDYKLRPDAISTFNHIKSIKNWK